MIILKFYSFFIVALLLGVSLMSKNISNKHAIMSIVMFVPILIYLLFGGVD